MRRWRADRAGSVPADAGVSLTELILSVALLGTATVTILGAFATLVKTSDLTRKTGDAGSTLAAVADAVTDNARNPYDASCATPAYDPVAGVALPATIQPADVTITSVKWWDGNAAGGDGAFGTTCFDDKVATWRLQLIEIHMRSTDGKIDRRINVVKRG